MGRPIVDVAEDVSRLLCGAAAYLATRGEPSTALPLHNLAVDFELLDEFQAARALNDDTLNRRRTLLGEDHPDTLTFADNLALDLYQLGEHHQARLLDEDTLLRRRRAVDRGSPANQLLHETLQTVLRRLGEPPRKRS